MVQRVSLCRLLAAVLFFAATLNLLAQGTAISYQGRLIVSGTPANTNYDFRFAVFDAPINGNMLSFSVTNFDTPVSNGLFIVKLDFGPGIFNGTDNGSNDWLDIGVRAIGGTTFTELTPRQPILPVPYALFAVSASNLLGSLQATQLVGNVSAGRAFRRLFQRRQLPQQQQQFRGHVLRQWRGPDQLECLEHRHRHRGRCVAASRMSHCSAKTRFSPGQIPRSPVPAVSPAPALIPA